MEAHLGNEHQPAIISSVRCLDGERDARALLITIKWPYRGSRGEHGLERDVTSMFFEIRVCRWEVVPKRINLFRMFEVNARRDRFSPLVDERDDRDVVALVIDHPEQPREDLFSFGTVVSDTGVLSQEIDDHTDTKIREVSRLTGEETLFSFEP